MQAKTIVLIILTCIIAIPCLFLLLQNKNVDTYERGMAYYQKGQYDQALLQFQADVKRQPEHSLGHYYAGLSLWKLGKTIPAHEEFAKAASAEMASDHPDASFAEKCQAFSKM